MLITQNIDVTQEQLQHALIVEGLLRDILSYLSSIEPSDSLIEWGWLDELGNILPFEAEEIVGNDLSSSPSEWGWLDELDLFDRRSPLLIQSQGCDIISF